LFEYQEKARSIQVYMSTFDAGIGQIRGELNSYAGLTIGHTPGNTPAVRHRLSRIYRRNKVTRPK
jgi:hypothetical protein